MAKIENIYPSDDFKVVCDNASKEIKVGIIIGYDNQGELTVFGGGLIDNKRPVVKDWLWMIEEFKRKLMNRDYCDE